jgi:hypothetical protein
MFVYLRGGGSPALVADVSVSKKQLKNQKRQRQRQIEAPTVPRAVIAVAFTADP